MPEPNKPSGFDDFDARLAKLKGTRRQHDSEPDADWQPPKKLGSGMKAWIENIAGVDGGSL